MEHTEKHSTEASFYPIQQKTFLFLIVVTSLVLCAILVGVWFIPTIGFSAIHMYLPYVVGFAVALSVLFILWGMLGLIVQMYTGKGLPGVVLFRSFFLNGLFPFIEFMARVFRISLKSVRHSFIDVNNRLVDIKQLYNAQDVLILLPHCVQASRCKLRLTYNSDNCVRCGKCSVGEVLALRDKWGVQLATATGGTMARNIIKQVRPKLIVGVACERDLVAGIQDVGALPVIGILNDCSKGVCIDTSVNASDIEAVLKKFIDPSLGVTSVHAQDDAVQSYIPVYKDIIKQESVEQKL